MLVSKWWLLCILAVIAAAKATPQVVEEDGWLDSDTDWDDDGDDDFIVEADLSDSDLDALANEIAEQIDHIDEEGYARGAAGGALKVVGKGIMKGGKKVVKVILTAGRKIIKVTGKGLKVIGKGAGKGLKVVGKGAGKAIKVIGKGAGKGLKIAGKGALKLGKMTAKGVIKGVKIAGKGVVKVAKLTGNYATKKGTKIWQSLKTQMKGELGKAGKKLLKAVGKQILEVGVSIAVEAIAPMIVEFVQQATQDGLCSCEAYACSCCAQPPGFEKGCLVMRVRPKLHFIAAAVTYNGKELAKVNITTEDSPEKCKKLTGLAGFITACIEPLGLGDFEDGFRGCLNINLEPIAIQRDMCVDFTGTFKNGTAKWVPVNELDDIELVVVEGEEGDEDGEGEE